MFRKCLLFLIDSVLWLTKLVVSSINQFADYSVRIWRNNVMRVWVLKLVHWVLRIFRFIINYLEAIGDSITFRIIYKKTTRPMKEYYRELKRNI